MRVLPASPNDHAQAQPPDHGVKRSMMSDQPKPQDEAQSGRLLPAAPGSATWSSSGIRLIGKSMRLARERPRNGCARVKRIAPPVVNVPDRNDRRKVKVVRVRDSNTKNGTFSDI